jgi:hypothetical protein
VSGLRWVYDVGMLIALERRNKVAVCNHLSLLANGDQVIVPAVVAAQAVPEPARQDRLMLARLMLALRGSDIVPFTKAHYAAVGRLLAASGTSDVVDGFVVILAARYAAGIVTSDVPEIAHLVKTLGADVPVIAA